MDPEQIYQEVLSEEQGKGSVSAVAEGRAKAARQRARHGSPHPKEPRWWPGSQPQFEGGGDAPAAEAPAEEEPVAEEAPAEEPAATPPDVGDQAQSERPDATAPAAPASTQAEQQAAPELAAAPAAAAVAAPPAAAEVPVQQQRPPGVTHGTDSGNRLRPEDSVGTDAQFDAQKALAERRRLIDELVATGVPAATAEESGRPKAPLLLLAYILIPVLAILLLSGQESDEAAGGEAPPPAASGPTTAIAAEGSKFDLEQITLVAGEATSLEFDNKDAGVQHNVSIYEGENAEGEEIFKGDLVTGPEAITYEFDAPEAGEYYFQCDVHPDMNGAVVSE